MKSIKHVLAALTVALALAGCGGGGSDGGAFTPPPVVTPNAPTITISSATSQTTPNSLVPFTVRVNAGNGAAIADGTVVTAQVTTSGVGLVSSVAPTAAIGERVTAPTAGGIATFRFHSRQVGNATVQVSITEPTPPERVITQNLTLSISAGPPSDARLTLVPVVTTLPVNPNNSPPFIGSPFMSEVTVTWRTLDGALVSTTNPRVSVSVNPVNPTGGFSTLDDPTTPDINEFLVRLGQGPVNVVAGRATLFFHAFNLPATALMTVTAVDPQLGDTIFATQEFRIQSGSPALPSSIVVLPVDDSPIYIQGTNGATSKQFETRIFDGASALVPNAPAGTNNIRVELVPGIQGGDRLRAVNAAGATVTGASIAIRSLNGVGSFVYESGSRAGLVTIRATADRSDNNVDNGIQDAVTSTRQLTVSDGVPFDLVITSPTQNAITVNPVTAGAITPGVGGIPEVPPSPNGSYSLTVAALVTDRFGNPVPAGTPVQFGLIDAPLSNNLFAIGGADGDPQEGGTLFTAPTGQFTTAGGGAGPGDTLLVFGKDVPGNRDLESARVVASINSPTSLTTRTRFNFNDDTGTSVNAGPVLPYVIGRATSGNIAATGLTDSRGVARTVMTYPVSRLGRLSAVHAQTAADVQQGSSEIATDISAIPFPGIAPARLTAAPEQITGNRTQPVTVCLQDALAAPIQGVRIGFTFQLGQAGGTGSIEGTQTSGLLPRLTGPNGCVTVDVTTQGVQSNAGEPRVRFSAGATGANIFADVRIVVGQLVLQAVPNTFFGSGVFITTLTLLDQNGNPIVGAQLSASCSASGQAGISVDVIPVTDSNGRTVATLTANGFTAVGSAPTGSCEFKPASGSPTTTVRVVGIDLCTVGDPQFIPGCPGFVRPGTLTVGGVAGATAASGTITSVPAGIDCSVPGSAGQCSAPASGTVTLQYVPSAGVFCRWSGGCTGASPVTNVTIGAGASVTCTAVIASPAAANCPPP